MDESGRARVESSALGTASIDFIDLDGDVVIAPFRWQILNIDEVIHAASLCIPHTCRLHVL